MASVPSTSFFSLPLQPWNQPASTRVAQYERRKRKRRYDGWSDEDGDVGETTDAASGVEPVSAGPSLVLTPNESHQYRVAGLPFDQELPGGRFPHGPAQDEHERYRKKHTPSQLLKALSTLSPPVYPPQSSAQQGNLRYQHLAVITAILHRCLLQGDYIRAGRAWGLILREEFKGLPMDVRAEGRWGIGAEILLRRGQQGIPGLAGRDRSIKDVPMTENRAFTKQGFADAKEYYERLILHHPYHKSAPDAISPLHFYPAMFGLWIYVTQEESNAARKVIPLNNDESSDDLSEAEDSPDEAGHHQNSRNKRLALTAAIRVKELEEAQQIAAHMDEILSSPPYSDSPALLELRGMVSLWVGDLFVSSLPSQPDNEDGFDRDAMFTDDVALSLEARRERRLAMDKRQAEIQKSMEFFEKAKRRGRSVAYNLEHFHIHDVSPLD